MPLPPVASVQEYHAALALPTVFEAASEVVARRHGLPHTPATRFSNGSSPVLALGEGHVVKFFAPLFAEHFGRERAALSRVGGRLGVPTPGLMAHGELDGWGYVVMERLGGRELREEWDDVDAASRLALAREVGAATARLHAVPTDGDEALAMDWPAFVARQVDGCADRHREKGLAEEWAVQIPGWLDAVLPTLDDGRPPVLLHTELMRDHVLVASGGGGWRVTGVIDFEPAMMGHPDYEMASVGVFVSAGDPALLGAFLHGMGRDPATVTPAERRRWLAWALLHRYGNLRWYLDILPHEGARTLDALAERWWAAE